MRNLWVLLAGASLVACNQRTADADSITNATVETTPAALSYDGADYADDNAAMLAHGERLSHVLGCRGCHTESLTGQRFPPEEGFPDTGIYASNLTQVLPKMSDAQIDALLRKAQHPTRDKLWMMPSENFQFLSDADVKALIAHLRTVKPAGTATPLPAPTPAFLKMVEEGQQNLPSAEMLAVHRDQAPADLGSQYALGRHIAMTTCAECHAASLQGYENFTPNLRDVAPMYDDAAMTKLLSTGEGLEGRKLGLMALVGQAHFSALTSHERKAVIDYVHALAKKEAGTPQ